MSQKNCTERGDPFILTTKFCSQLEQTMLNIGKLFGRSPFSSLQVHMEKVADCIHKLGAVFSALEIGDYALLEELAEQVSTLEHGADLLKNDLRIHLPRSLFLPIPRADLLDILSLQDSIADRAEEIAILVTLRQLTMPEEIKIDLKDFFIHVTASFEGAHAIIRELTKLLETSFGGAEADKVRVMVEEVAHKERETELIKHKLRKTIFRSCDQMPAPEFTLWVKIFENAVAISSLSEKLSHRIQQILEAK